MFANPLALWLLLLLPIPLLLTRRRPPVRRRAVSNLYLWKTLDHNDPALTSIRRIRKAWLVAVQMAFMAIVIAALARPTLAFKASRVTFVFDVSGSMGAHDALTTRFDLARERARAILADLPRRAHVHLVAAGPSPRNLGEYAVGDPALDIVLKGIAPTAGSADLDAAIEVARAGGGMVYVFSDRSEREVTGSSERGNSATTWEAVGHPADNVAITHVAGRRLPSNPVNGQVLVAVRNYGAHARDDQVEIAQDGAVIARETLRIDARSEQHLVVDAAPIGHVISARLLERDALDADNGRSSVVSPRQPVRVALITRGNLFLEKALAANPDVSLRQIPFDAAAQAPAMSGDLGDVVVCDGCRDLPQARGVVIIPPVNDSSAPAPLTIARPDHPIAASLDFSGLLAMPFATERVPVDGDVVMRVGGLPAVVAYEKEGRRIVELRLDISTPDLTLNTAFPILIANAIDWVAARDENAREIQSGDPLSWILHDLPSGRSVSVIGPDGRARSAQTSGLHLTVVGTELPGVYTVRTPLSTQVFVVNPAVDTESDLLSAETDTTQAGDSRNQPLSVQRTIGPLLLVLALGLLLLEWRYRRGRPIWRLIVAACLLLAASGLALVPRRGPLEIVALLDRSGSVPARSQQRDLARVNAIASTMRQGDRLGVVAFGSDAVVEARPAGQVRLPAVSSTIVDTDTNIAAALKLARAVLPAQGTRRILLLSDGRETLGRAEREAAYSAAEGIPVDVLRPEAVVSRQSAITRVVAPPAVRVHEPFAVSVEIEGAAGTRAQLSLLRDDQPYGSIEVPVPSAGSTSTAFFDRYEQPGLHTYRAFLRDADGFDDDPGAGAVVSVSGEASVLYVAAAGDRLKSVFEQAGFHVKRTLPASLPTSVSDLAVYDAVVLDDVAAEDLQTNQMAPLARYVEETGGGLLILGSARSLDLAGYPTGPLASLLPVDLRPRAGRRAPSLGLVLVFDKSGSMSDLADGTPKIEIARQAVLKVLDVLPSTDSLGVIAFDSSPVPIAPLAADHDPRTIADRLRTIRPSGPTLIAPAASLALQWLHASPQRSRRQILLVSDGRTSPDDAVRLRELFRNTDVEVSTVAIGSSADRELLRQLADSTGGRAYFPSDLADLPAIVARAAVRSAAGTIVEEPFMLRGAPHPVLAGIDRSSLPQMGGYVVSVAKPTAATILASHLDDPILSAWRAGLGRVGVFTGDLGSAWSGPLRKWSGFPRLWAQSLRWVSRGLDDRSLRLALSEVDGVTRISLAAEAPDGSALDLLDARAVVRLPTGETQEILLGATAPGRYEAPLSATHGGLYAVLVSGRDGVGGEHRTSRGFYWSANRERRAEAPDLALLTRLADITGGHVLGDEDSPFRAIRPREFTDVSTWLVAAALLTYLLEMLTPDGLSVVSLYRRLWAPRRVLRQGHAA